MPVSIQATDRIEPNRNNRQQNEMDESLVFTGLSFFNCLKIDRSSGYGFERACGINVSFPVIDGVWRVSFSVIDRFWRVLNVITKRGSPLGYFEKTTELLKDYYDVNIVNFPKR